MSKKVLLTGAKPTGELHLGNYFGMIKPAISSTEGTDESYIFIADLHALTTVQNAKEMEDGIFHLAAAYIAAGLDISRTILFKQSDVPVHGELAWIFDCITTMPYLMRAHAYKDSEAKNNEISVGVFNYPMLMAADILLYDTTLVPVGQDQKQHVEYARDTAEKFNRVFGETFILPEPKIVEGVGVVPGTDGRKMSKSYKNVIPLFGTSGDVKKVVMTIVTDSTGERPENVYAIHRLFKSEDELKELYEKNKGNYKTLKEALLEDIEVYISPMRDKYNELISNKVGLKNILKEGGEKARLKAENKMAEIRKKIGVGIY